MENNKLISKKQLSLAIITNNILYCTLQLVNSTYS